MDKKELENLDYEAPKTTKRTEPNKNIVIIQRVQNLNAQIGSELINLEVTNDKQKAARAIAIEEVNLFEKTTLDELQKVFE